MPAPKRHSFPSSQPGLEWLVTDDGSRTLRDRIRDECYHSGCGAVSESWVVYMRQSGVEERLVTRQATRVLEYGLGTGTSLILTAALAELFQCELFYGALENNWLPPEVIMELRLEAGIDHLRRQGTLGYETADRIGPVLARLQSQFAEYLATLRDQDLSSGYHSTGGELGSYTRLKLVHADASQLTAEQIRMTFGAVDESSFDAVFFDPFAPAVNPELWCPGTLQIPFQVLKGGGTLTSYCVKGAVRRDLAKVGFAVRCVPGPPGGKREVLLAVKPLVLRS